ncbi:glycosyl hydrolase [Neobacillus niacini]|uniref:glycosyl hydrolase n=1 Tax=Neobacillus niacini TaxID=86668 RepID=UPI001E1240F6|nr:glycosyl hydrolase [Neobacillus niacini]MBY0144400.1 glycosyl hydrolase [Neobacillus niacini]
MNIPNAPLFRDPIYDGAADPVIIWNTVSKEWWLIYTNRRAAVECQKNAWVHGTDLGIASSSDGGKSWTYRGVIEGLDFERGRNTFWAPEIIWNDGLYHMYVSYIQGVPTDWSGHKRKIIHYTSTNLWGWTYESELKLSSDYVIDAGLHKLPNGKWRMWYKDEANHSHTYAADSPDLFHWEVVGPVITGFPHEGPNVFYWKNSYWMIIDQWSGLGVYQSSDGEEWIRNGIILNESGTREDDGTIGMHADVHVNGDNAYIFYFTHPERFEGVEPSYKTRRSSIQAAKLELVDGTLVCNRNSPFDLFL